MFTKRDILIFLAGAEAFHTFSHIIIAYHRMLPMKLLKYVYINWTAQFGPWLIMVNLLITVLLLWWASHTNKRA